MPRFSEERKSAVLKKLLPPHNRSVPDVAREEDISEKTLYNWRKKLRDKGLPVPRSEQNRTHRIKSIALLTHPVIEFKRFANRALEADSIAEKIMHDIHHEGLSADRQSMVIVFSGLDQRAICTACT